MMSTTQIRRVEGAARVRAFAFIRQQFAQHFGADIEDDTSELYAVLDSAGKIQAAFGLNRDADAFFCRHYVGDVESVLDNAYPLARMRNKGHIVELSHLCVRQPATLCRLIKPLTQFLAREAEYLICTVTQELGRFFQRKGLTSHRAAYATIEQLPQHNRTGWGDYYSHQPTVVLGSLADACRTLTKPEGYAELEGFSEELRKSA